MAVKVIKKDGSTVTLLNPAEKGQLYARELKDNYNPRTGNELSKTQRSYRSGYLDARKDSAKAWKHNKEKKAKARKSKKG